MEELICITSEVPQLMGCGRKIALMYLGVIDHLNKVEKIIKPLESLDFIYKGEYGISDRHYFSKRSYPKIHLHVCPKGHEQIQRHLHFVQVMNSNPKFIEELNTIKIELAKTYPQKIYQQKKTSAL